MNCNKCGAPKDGLGGVPAPAGYQAPGQQGGYQGQAMYQQQDSYGGYGAMRGGSQTQQSTPYGGGGGMGGGKDMRPGDWMCPTCNNHNFASRTNCKNCNVPKPGMAGSGYSNVMPDNAGLVKGANMGAMPMPSYHVPGTGHPDGKLRQFRPGDWICSSCSNHNFASRDSCKRCSMPKNVPPPQSVAAAFRPGDWYCPQCQNHNFASRDTCNKCNAHKPPNL